MSLLAILFPRRRSGLAGRGGPRLRRGSASAVLSRVEQLEPRAMLAIDTTPPATPGLPDLITADDSGAAVFNNITKVTRPTFTGTVEAGARVGIYVNGSLDREIVATTGAYSIKLSSPLVPDGIYAITTKATDKAGNVSGSSAPLNVTIDTVAPNASGFPVTAPVAKSYKAGTTLSFAVKFTSPVAVVGKPGIPLVIGQATGLRATYVGGSGTDTLTFRYTVVAGNNGNVALANNEITLPVGASIRSIRNGTDATRTFITPDLNGVIVDTVAPTLTITSDKSSLKAGQTANLQFTFSEAVLDFTENDVVVTNGKLSGFTGAGATYFATFTPTQAFAGTGIVTVNAGKFTDTAGNANAVAASLAPAVAINTTPPFSIRFDYAFDTAGFFNTPERRDALERAATVLESRVSDTLDAIVPNAAQSRTWTATTLNTIAGTTISIANPTIAANEIVVYVAGGNIPGTKLAIASSGGYATGPFPIGSNWPAVISGRGEAGALARPASDYAPWGGFIGFDSGVNWSFSAQTPASTQYDFESMALHELLHVFGFGIAGSYTRLVSGGSFTGSKAVAAFGKAIPLTGDNHAANSVISGGQASIMVAALPSGTKRTLTTVDWAVLQDIGWEIR